MGAARTRPSAASKGSDLDGAGGNALEHLRARIVEAEQLSGCVLARRGRQPRRAVMPATRARAGTCQTVQAANYPEYPERPR